MKSSFLFLFYLMFLEAWNALRMTGFWENNSFKFKASLIPLSHSASDKYPLPNEIIQKNLGILKF